MDDQPSFFSIAEARLKRRELLGTLAALPLLTLDSRPAAARAIGRKSGFSPIPRTQADSVTVPSSYSVRTLISWGDPLFESAVGSFDPDRITRADQELRFGTNNDMLALFPARHAVPEPPDTDRAILCANNEHFEASLMYPSLPSREAFGMDQLQAMYAALGVSVVELERRGQHWWPVVNKRPGRGRNRRITPFTPVAFGGPAASHRWIRQAAAVVHAHEQPGLAGSVACGTMVNCAGGRTPWGSYLTCEEGFPYYFSMSDNNAATVQAARADPAWAADGRSYSYPLPTERLLPLAPPQFDLSINPTGPSLYGWVLEIDPYDSASIPVKRTALGRRWNEGATTAVGRDGRVAVYSGDDTPNQFVYKFVTHGRLDRRNRSANFGLLDSGTLHVARFEEDGSGRWLPLTFETVSAAVAAANHPVPFEDFGDMLMRTRESARLLGATPMDRPEDIEPMLDANWVGLGPVLINCTGNATPKTDTPGNPRRGEEPQANFAGHIIRIDEDGNDSCATSFRWDVFALCGDPEAKSPTRRSRSGREVHVSTIHRGMPTMIGDRMTSPDNICFDGAGNAWVTTNGMGSIFGDTNDAVVVLPMDGTTPRLAKTFLIGPVGCEICGPTFAFDERTFFAAIQHPGSDGLDGRSHAQMRWPGGERPPSSWPHGGNAWPLPSVVAVTKDDGGIIGS